MTISTDELFNLFMGIKSSPALMGDISNIINQILISSEYNRWLENDQFDDNNQFHIPGSISGTSHDLLERFGIIRDDKLQIKVHKYNNKVFITDGLWTRKDLMVFPFFDESNCLLNYISDNKIDLWADILIDPATGCGHHPISFPKQGIYSAALDINPRAVLFTSINKIINYNYSVMPGLNDISWGIPDIITRSISGNVLFLVNMPFALSPLSGVLPLTSDGGMTGAKLTFAALDAIYNFSKNNNKGSSVRACVLCYSVGNYSEQRWEVVEYASRLFGDDKIEWRVLEKEKIWRINGKKEQPNPMSLMDGLPLKADCKFYVKNKNRDNVREEYKNLAYTLVNSENRWDVLGYGVVDIQI